MAVNTSWKKDEVQLQAQHLRLLDSLLNTSLSSLSQSLPFGLTQETN